MLNHEEFIPQHKRSVDASAQASLSKLPEVNLTGHTAEEALCHLIGVYVSNLVHFSMSANQDAQHTCLSLAAGTLIKISHFIAERNTCWSDYDADSLDEVSLSLIDNQLADFCRMNPLSFVGYAMTYCDFAVKDQEDAAYWVSMQFDLLSKYAFTHFIDLPHLINSLN